MTQLRRVRGVNRVGGVVGRFGPNGESGVWPVHALASDPYYDDVSLLLHMDGTNGSTTFADSSKYGHSVTTSGDAKVSTTESQFGGASLLLDGTGDWLEIPHNAIFNLSTVDFTLEGWFRLDVVNKLQAFIGKDSALNPGRGFQWRFNNSPSASLQFVSFSSGTSFTVATNTFSFAQNTWYHIAMTRTGTSIEHFVDGQSIGTGNCVSTIFNTISPLRIGALGIAQPDTIPLQGFIDEVRITRRARYRSAFTPPARAFLP